MSERNRFLKSGAMLTAVALAMRTVSMFFGAFVTRTVGAEGTGLYTIVMTVYSFAVTLATSGISLTVTRLVASAIGENKRCDIPKILRGAMLYSLAFGMLATVFLYFGASFLGGSILADERSVISLKVLAFSLLPISLGSVFSGYFVGVKRVEHNAAVQVLGQFAKIGITTILVVKMAKFGIASAVAALCTGITVTEILAFLFIFLQYLLDRKRHSVGREGGTASRLADVAKMAIPLALSAYVRSVLLNVEHILIPTKLRERGESGEESYSHYGTLHGMALPLILYPMTPLSSFSGLLVPEFAETLSSGNRKRMSRVASEALNTTLTYAAICSVLIYVFAEELGYAIYNSYDAGYYVSILAPIVPIMYLDHVTDSMLKGIGEQVFSMWVNISDSMLSVALVWFLIPRLGIMGYAVVIVVMEGYNFILSFLRLRKKIKFEIGLVNYLVVPLASALVSACLSKLLFNFGGNSVSPLWLVMKMVFSLCVTLGILLLLRSLQQIKSVEA